MFILLLYSFSFVALGFTGDFLNYLSLGLSSELSVLSSKLYSYLIESNDSFFFYRIFDKYIDVFYSIIL